MRISGCLTLSPLLEPCPPLPCNRECTTPSHAWGSLGAVIPDPCVQPLRPPTVTLLDAPSNVSNPTDVVLCHSPSHALDSMNSPCPCLREPPFLCDGCLPPVGPDQCFCFASGVPPPRSGPARPSSFLSARNPPPSNLRSTAPPRSAISPIPTWVERCTSAGVSRPEPVVSTW